MKTITISIGNSDNKLTQKEWSEFVERVNKLILMNATRVHFFGGAANWMPWQNVAWIFDCEDRKIHAFKEALTFLRMAYQQDSACYLESVTELI